jgi:hypothetical protein
MIVDKKAFSKGLEKALRRMCKIVDCDYDTFDFGKDMWWREYEWTEKEETKFKTWLNRELKKYRYMRELARTPELMKDEVYREGFVNYFVNNFGWITKKEKNVTVENDD